MGLLLMASRRVRPQRIDSILGADDESDKRRSGTSGIHVDSSQSSDPYRRPHSLDSRRNAARTTRAQRSQKQKCFPSGEVRIDV